VIEAPQHDGSIIKLRKVASDYDPTRQGRRYGRGIQQAWREDPCPGSAMLDKINAGLR